jgi:hypothetical protein
MSIWAIIWVVVVSVFAALGTRNAYRLYQRPHDVRNSAISMNSEQARRAAFAAMIGMPVIWLLIVLSTFELAPF